MSDESGESGATDDGAVGPSGESGATDDGAVGPSGAENPASHPRHKEKKEDISDDDFKRLIEMLSALEGKVDAATIEKLEHSIMEMQQLGTEDQLQLANAKKENLELALQVALFRSFQEMSEPEEIEDLHSTVSNLQKIEEDEAQLTQRVCIVSQRQAESGGFEGGRIKQLNTYVSSTGNEYFLLDVNPDARIIDQEDKSLRKCSNCFRNRFLFSNTPCMLACGHSFCEVCIKTEKKIQCVPCNKTYNTSDEKKYIVNKSLISLYNTYVERHGIEKKVDLTYRNKQKEVTLYLRMLFAYLPFWADQKSRVLRLHTTMEFWREEMEIFLKDKRLQKFPELLLQEKMKLADLLKTMEGSLAGITEKLINVDLEHSNGVKVIPETYSTKGLDLSPVFKRYDNLYFSTYINGNRFYMKMSGGHEVVFLHSGFWAKTQSSNFAKENLIFESTKELNEFQDLFMDVTFRSSDQAGKVHTCKLCFIRNNQGEYAERIFSLLTGQFQPIKGSSILNDNTTFIIPEKQKQPILEVPSKSAMDDKVEPLRREQLKESAIVSFIKNNIYYLGIVTDPEKGVKEYYAKPYLQVRSFGRLETGISFLQAMADRKLNAGKIEDCGLILSWKML